MTADMARQHLPIVSAPVPPSTSKPIPGHTAQDPVIPPRAAMHTTSSWAVERTSVHQGASRDSRTRVGIVRPPSYVSPQTCFVSQRYHATRDSVYPRRLWQDIVREAGTQFIAKTGDINALEQYPVECSMLDPCTAWENIDKDDTRIYFARVGAHQALYDTSYTMNKVRHMSLRAAENYIVELGVAMMAEHSGLHFTFIDPRRTHKEQIVNQAIRMTEKFKQKHVDTSRVIFSFPATSAGIESVDTLEQMGIRTNLTYVTTALHAAACMSAGASAITFSLASNTKLFNHPDRVDRARWELAEDRAIHEIQATIALQHTLNTDSKIIVTDVSNVDNVQPLWGVDYIAMSAHESLHWKPVDPTNELEAEGDFVFTSASIGSETVKYAVTIDGLVARNDKNLLKRFDAEVAKAWRSTTYGWKRAREDMRMLVQDLAKELHTQSIGTWSPHKILKHFYKSASAASAKELIYKWQHEPVAGLHDAYRRDIFGCPLPEYAEELKYEDQLIAESNLAFLYKRY